MRVLFSKRDIGSTSLEVILDEDVVVQDALIRAGWFPARRKDDLVDEWTRRLEGVEGFCVFDSVKEVLLEFGGLTIRASGPGVDLAKGSCVFDPLLAVSEGDRFALRSEEVGVGLCPIGEAYDGHCFMAMDEVGRVYFVMDKVFLVADSIWGALRVLVLGRSPGSTG